MVCAPQEIVLPGSPTDSREHRVRRRRQSVRIERALQEAQKLCQVVSLAAIALVEVGPGRVRKHPAIRVARAKGPGGLFDQNLDLTRIARHPSPFEKPVQINPTTRQAFLEQPPGTRDVLEKGVFPHPEPARQRGVRLGAARVEACRQSR